MVRRVNNNSLKKINDGSVQFLNSKIFILVLELLMAEASGHNETTSAALPAPKLKIVYWSDIACPFCYIGETRLRNAIKSLNLEDQVEWEMKSFELDPGAPSKPVGATVDRFMKKYHLTISEAHRQVDYISELGKELGIDFRYSSTRYSNTFNAHRLIKLLHAKGNNTLTDKLIDLLYDAYFTQNLDVNSPDVLISLAAKVGVSRAEVEQLLADHTYAEEVRRDEQDAYRRGIHGVPYFLFNGKHPISGAASIDSFKATLTTAVSQQNAIPSYGAACSKDGCVTSP